LSRPALLDYSHLQPGDVISDQTFLLDGGSVARYIEAVDDRSGACLQNNGRGLAPPMAVAALGLRGVLQALAIPPGTLHVGQELEFHGAVRVGETLRCMATLLQSSVRGQRRFMVVQLTVEDREGQVVMGGRSTLMLPA
jgi:acyl dehydratase